MAFDPDAFVDTAAIDGEPELVALVAAAVSSETIPVVDIVVDAGSAPTVLTLLPASPRSELLIGTLVSQAENYSLAQWALKLRAGESVSGIGPVLSGEIAGIVEPWYPSPTNNS